MNATVQETSPRIYVASLSDYNAGRLVGRWIDADQDAEGIAVEVAAMLAEDGEPGAEEWVIHDHEGFEGFDVGEWSSFETVAQVAAAIVEFGPAWVAYVNHVGGVEYADSFEEAFAGEWRSEEEFAEELAEDLGAIPADFSWPASYIDWERAARDLFMGDYFSVDAAGGGVYVFRSI